MLLNECFEAAEACSLHLQRSQLNVRLFFETYIQISSASHIFYCIFSVPLTKLYIYRAVDGRWALFSCCLSDLLEERTNERRFTEAQRGPLVVGRGSADALQRFSSIRPQFRSVLSFCSHSVWAFTVKSAADLEKILHTEVLSKSYRILFGEADGLLWQWAAFHAKWKHLRCVHGFNSFIRTFFFLHLLHL